MHVTCGFGFETVMVTWPLCWLPAFFRCMYAYAYIGYLSFETMGRLVMTAFKVVCFGGLGSSLDDIGVEAVYQRLIGSDNCYPMCGTL